jgi:vancomycin resistance protein YoaR
MPAVKGQKIEAKYDGETLYALIKEGKTMSEIMATLGVKSKPTLMNHLMKLMQEKKEFLEIAGSGTRTRSTSPVCRGGKIVLSANMLKGIEIEEGQKFVLEKTEDGLKLKKI